MLSRLPRLAPVTVAVMLATPAAHADWRFTPSLRLATTYSDNLYRQSDELAQSQLLTEIAPSFSLSVNERRLKMAATAGWQQFLYTHDDGDQQRRQRNDHARRFSGSLQGILAEDLLFLDANANVSRRSILPFGPQAENNPFSAENSTEVRSWSISPYLVQRFGRQANSVLRYTRSAVDSGARARFGDTVSDTLLYNLSSGSAYQVLGWGLSYVYQKQDNELTSDYSTRSVNANLRYQLDGTFALTASAGYDRYDYNALSGRNAGRNWSTGFVWTPSQRSSIAASFGRHFYGNTGSLDASVRSRRTVWDINYGDIITTSQSQFTLPAAIDTSALLDRLFTTTIPDPVQRQLAVAAYMQQTGLPPSLADNINYLSNRFMRQKSLQASAAVNLARSTAVLALVGSERRALSSQESDSQLLGPQLASLNDNVRQRGVNALWSYRLNPRSNIVASVSFSRQQSLSQANVRDTRQRDLRLGMTRVLGRHVQGTLDLRRSSGSYGLTTARDYTENALSATITMKL